MNTINQTVNFDQVLTLFADAVIKNTAGAWTIENTGSFSLPGIVVGQTYQTKDAAIAALKHSLSQYFGVKLATQAA
jgi:hypothetical protein